MSREVGGWSEKRRSGERKGRRWRSTASSRGRRTESRKSRVKRRGVEGGVRRVERVVGQEVGEEKERREEEEHKDKKRRKEEGELIT